MASAAVSPPIAANVLHPIGTVIAPLSGAALFAERTAPDTNSQRSGR
jgi:hypothetical protein